MQNMDSLFIAVLSLALVLLVHNVCSSSSQGADDSNAQATAINSKSGSSGGGSSGGGSSGSGSSDASDIDIHKLMRRYVPQFLGKKELNSVATGFSDKTAAELKDDADDIINDKAKSLRQFINSTEVDTESVVSDENQEIFKFDRDLNFENEKQKNEEEQEAAKRYQPTFIGKKYRTFFGGRQNNPMFVGKRYKPMFIGKRYKPVFIGKRYKPMFIGKRYKPMFVGKRYLSTTIEKKKYQPSFVGKRYTPRFIGKRYTPSFVGKRYTPSFVGKRYTQTFVGKRYTPSFVGKRYTPSFVGKRDGSSNVGRMYIPSFVGKRNPAMLSSSGKLYAPKFESQSNDVDYHQYLLSLNSGKQSNSESVGSKSVHDLKQNENAINNRRKRSTMDENDDHIQMPWSKYSPWQYIRSYYPLVDKRFVTPEFIGRRNSLSSIMSALDFFQYTNNPHVSADKRFQAPMFIGKRNLAEVISPENRAELGNSELIPEKLKFFGRDDINELYRDSENLMCRSRSMRH